MSEIINPTQKWKLLGRHQHVVGAEIREYLDVHSDGWIRRYTATIRGWQKWYIGAGSIARGDYTFQQIIDRVREIRDRIDAGDRTVFDKTLYNPTLIDQPTITRADIQAIQKPVTQEP